MMLGPCVCFTVSEQRGGKVKRHTLALDGKSGTHLQCPKSYWTLHMLLYICFHLLLSCRITSIGLRNVTVFDTMLLEPPHISK
jgi:hypothetical protein